MAEEIPATQRSWPWRRWILLAVRTFLMGYAVMVIGFTLLQRYLVYVPSHLTQASAEESAAKAGFVPWYNATHQLMGWRLPARSAPVGSVLILHGNAGWALNRAYMAIPIQAAAPLEVFILEYPGFGSRPGSPGEDSLLRAAEEAFENLPRQNPSYLVSESLGTGVAAHLARKYPARVAGMALFVPYDKLASVAQNHVPFIPAYFLLWDRFEPLAWLKEYHGPVKVIVAGADEIIPPRLGEQLYEGYQGPKLLEIIPGAHHSNTTDESPEWWKDLLAFWQQHPAGSRPAPVTQGSVTPE